MRIRLFILGGLIFSAATIVAAYQDETLTFSRPTLDSVILKNAPKTPPKVYEDKEFAFHYKRPAPGEITAGFFAYNKKLKKWIEIKKLTTENARLGRFPSGEEVSLSVGKKPYIELPLKTGKSVSHPSKIKYDANTEVYHVEFESWQNKEEFAIRLLLDKEDLEEAFVKSGSNEK